MLAAEVGFEIGRRLSAKVGGTGHTMTARFKDEEIENFADLDFLLLPDWQHVIEVNKEGEEVLLKVHEDHLGLVEFKYNALTGVRVKVLLCCMSLWPPVIVCRCLQTMAFRLPYVRVFCHGTPDAYTYDIYEPAVGQGDATVAGPGTPGEGAGSGTRGNHRTSFNVVLRLGDGRSATVGAVEVPTNITLLEARYHYFMEL